MKERKIKEKQAETVVKKTKTEELRKYTREEKWSQTQRECE